MSRYFSYFQPFLQYNDVIVTDITKRARIRETIRNNTYVFLPYTVQGNDRPEDVSYLYYENVQYTWIIYLANDIIDPYHQWVMDDITFDNYLIKKYQEESGKVGRQVIEWTQNETITSNIKYVENRENPDIKISAYTFLNDSTIVSSQWKPVRYFEYEEITNNNKRHIQLVNRSYLDTFVTEISTVMRN
jgi:hypothetical protein